MTDKMNEYDRQFQVEPEYYKRSFDFLNWYRYYFIIKEVFDSNSQKILEVGVGNGIVRNCLKPMVSNYYTMDINEKLNPDIIADVLVPQQRLFDSFDTIIIADVVEHLPFERMDIIISNLNLYLKKGGIIIITIPHRRSNFLFMSPTYIPHVFTIPTGFLSFGAFYRRFIKKRIWIDPHHCWEIGDGDVEKKDVEGIFISNGCRINMFKKLLYVDYWKLEK